jgi:hypothetical protein
MKCILQHSFNNLGKLKVLNILSTANNTPQEKACFLNINCIIIIFMVAGKYPIRKNKWNIWSDRTVIN